MSNESSSIRKGQLRAMDGANSVRTFRARGRLFAMFCVLPFGVLMLSALILLAVTVDWSQASLLNILLIIPTTGFCICFIALMLMNIRFGVWIDRSGLTVRGAIGKAKRLSWDEIHLVKVTGRFEKYGYSRTVKIKGTENEVHFDESTTRHFPHALALIRLFLEEVKLPKGHDRVTLQEKLTARWWRSRLSGDRLCKDDLEVLSGRLTEFLPTTNPIDVSLEELGSCVAALPDWDGSIVDDPEFLTRLGKDWSKRWEANMSALQPA